ncbi:Pkinase-domain-containing protein [Rhizopus microsporus ATCC 52813]|uniref:non-specific serine/threonine protein kinase n=2 Tax=Rhizopus microsporus TaxID=58291 RepID=A0A2G4ST51_RHIZD|nr:Pkinase-domain-containing protein [Rhizopus microsporus ATCC 52813]PHZ11967.1 Pkinase-domain-containing protein [Rhizopus microsporus ATCC 52813]
MTTPHLNPTSTSSSTTSYSSTSSASSCSIPIHPTECSKNARRHRADTASLKEYGECYRRLGQGTTAVVMVVRQLGEDGRSEKLYAIKQFRKKRKHESEKEYMKKLTSEFCISSTFSHPNVIETIDLVLDERKRYCTVMEYCPGGDLFTCIMAERMTELEKLCCFKQMLQGLAYLHSMGVAHRDIKPENLLLTMDGTVKITDFGVSDVFRFPWESKGRQSRGLVGSEPYIAPEAIENKEYWGHLADVWSAGIVFYCICVGGLAWHIAKKTDHSYANYLRALEQQKLYELFRPLGANERRIIHRMLDPNPSTRITSSELLEDAWIKSISVCNNNSVDDMNRVHKHTEGVQPVCTLSKK